MEEKRLSREERLELRKQVAEALGELIKLATGAKGWPAVFGNMGHQKVAPHIKTIREASTEANPVILTWGLRAGRFDEACRLMEFSGNDLEWSVIRARGFEALAKITGTAPTWSRFVARRLFQGLRPEKVDAIVAAVREACGFSANSRGSSDPLAIVDELAAMGSRDPGEDFVRWLNPPKREERGGRQAADPFAGVGEGLEEEEETREDPFGGTSSASTTPSVEAEEEEEYPFGGTSTPPAAKTAPPAKPTATKSTDEVDEVARKLEVLKSSGKKGSRAAAALLADRPSIPSGEFVKRAKGLPIS